MDPDHPLKLPRADAFKPENFLSPERRIAVATEELRLNAQQSEKLKEDFHIFIKEPVPAPLARPAAYHAEPSLTQSFGHAAAGYTSEFLNALCTGAIATYAVILTP